METAAQVVCLPMALTGASCYVCFMLSALHAATAADPETSTALSLSPVPTGHIVTAASGNDVVPWAGNSSHLECRACPRGAFATKIWY